jgi:hypothetical protein
MTGFQMAEPVYSPDGKIVGYRNKYTGQTMDPKALLGGSALGAGGGGVSGGGGGGGGGGGKTAVTMGDVPYLRTAAPADQADRIAEAQRLAGQVTPAPEVKPTSTVTPVPTTTGEGPKPAAEIPLVTASPVERSREDMPYAIPGMPYKTPEEVNSAIVSSNDQYKQLQTQREGLQGDVNSLQYQLDHLDMGDRQRAQVSGMLETTRSSLNNVISQQMTLQHNLSSPIIEKLSKNDSDNSSYFGEQGQVANARQIAENQLKTIQKISEMYRPDTFAAEKTTIAKALSSLGVDVPDSAMNNASAFEVFREQAMKGVFSKMAQIPGAARNMEQAGLSQTSATPANTPAAVQTMLAQDLGGIDYMRDKYQAEIAAKATHGMSFDKNRFESDWIAKHDLQSYIDARKKDIAIRGATPTDPSKLQPGQAYIVEPEMALSSQIKTPTKLIFKRLNENRKPIWSIPQ